MYNINIKNTDQIQVQSPTVKQGEKTAEKTAFNELVAIVFLMKQGLANSADSESNLAAKLSSANTRCNDCIREQSQLTDFSRNIQIAREVQQKLENNPDADDVPDLTTQVSNNSIDVQIKQTGIQGYNNKLQNNSFEQNNINTAQSTVIQSLNYRQQAFKAVLNGEQAVGQSITS